MEQPLITAVTHSTAEARITLTGVPDAPGAAARIFQALAEANCNVDMIVQNEPVPPAGSAPRSRSPSRARTCARRARRSSRSPARRSGRWSTARGDGQGLDRRRRHALASGCRRDRSSACWRGGRQHRHDLDLADQDLLRDRRATACPRRCGRSTAPSSSPARARSPSRTRSSRGPRGGRRPRCPVPLRNLLQNMSQF